MAQAAALLLLLAAPAGAAQFAAQAAACPGRMPWAADDRCMAPLLGASRSHSRRDVEASCPTPFARVEQMQRRLDADAAPQPEACRPAAADDGAGTSVAAQAYVVRVQALLNEAYLTAADLVAGRRVAIYCHVYDDGAGDALLGLKLRQMLQAGVPGLHVVLVSNEPDLMRKFSANGDFGFDPATIHAADSTFQQAQDLIIESPEGFSPFWASRPRYDAPILKIFEYGFESSHHNRNVLTTGVGRLDAGILIDAELAARSRSVQRGTVGSAARRHPMLDAFGHACGPSLLNGRSAAAYDGGTRMHFLYVSCRESVLTQVNAAIDYHGDRPTHLDVILVRHAQDALRAVPTTWAAAHRRWGASFASVDLVNATQPIGPPPSPAGRALRLVFVETLAHADFLRGLMLAEFVGVTGDQSVSEAIAADRVFTYDQREHKKNFVAGLKALACRAGVRTHAALTRLVDPACAAAPQVDLSDPQVQAGLRWVRATIRQEHDLAPRAVGRVVRALLQAAPTLRAAEASVEDLLPSADRPSADRRARNHALAAGLERLMLALDGIRQPPPADVRRSALRDGWRRRIDASRQQQAPWVQQAYADLEAVLHQQGASLQRARHGNSGAYFLETAAGERRWVLKAVESDYGAPALGQVDGQSVFTTTFPDIPVLTAVQRELAAAAVIRDLGLAHMHAETVPWFMDLTATTLEDALRPGSGQTLVSAQRYIQGTTLDLGSVVEAMGAAALQRIFAPQALEDALLLLWALRDNDAHLQNFMVQLPAGISAFDFLWGSLDPPPGAPARLIKIDSGLALPERNSGHHGNPGGDAARQLFLQAGPEMLTETTRLRWLARMDDPSLQCTQHAMDALQLRLDRPSTAASAYVLRMQHLRRVLQLPGARRLQDIDALMQAVPL